MINLVVVTFWWGIDLIFWWWGIDYENIFLGMEIFGFVGFGYGKFFGHVVLVMGINKLNFYVIESQELR